MSILNESFEEGEISSSQEHEISAEQPSTSDGLISIDKKEDLVRLIKEDDTRSIPRIFFVKRNESLSNIYFSPSGDRKNAKKIAKFVYCQKCKHVISHGSQETYHVEKGCPVNRKRKISEEIPREPTMAERALFTDAISKWVAKNSLPFTVVSTNEFEQMLTIFQQITMEENKQLDLKKLVPCPNTVKNHIAKMAEGLRMSHSHRIAQVLKKIGGSLSVDYGKRINHYISISLHIIENWELKSIHIGMKRCDFEKKTSDKVWTDITAVFKEFGIPSVVFKRLLSVSDEAANLKRCLTEKTVFHVSCAAHVFNTICKRSLKPYKLGLQVDPSDAPYIDLSLKICQLAKSIANEIRHTAIECGLRAAVIETDVRWLSKLQNLRWVKINLDELLIRRTSAKFVGFFTQELMDSLDEIAKMRTELEYVTNFLEIFENPIKTFQSAKPTLHLVWPEWVALKNRLVSYAHFSEMQKSLVASALLVIQRKEKDGFISLVHKVATLLHPSFKRLSLFPIKNEHKNRIKNHAKSWINEPTMENSQTTLQISAYSHLPTDIDETSESEIERYIATSFQNIPENILEFWSHYENEFPAITKLVRRLFSLPGSSAIEENHFSELKHLLNDRRTCLSPNILSDMFVIRSLS